MLVFLCDGDLLDTIEVADDVRPFRLDACRGQPLVEFLAPVVHRLRQRFGITRMCVCADRGMISAATIAELEANGIEYILGAREGSDAEVRDVVLADERPMVAMVIPRAHGKQTTLEVKEVVVGAAGAGSKPRRYIVNPEEAKRDAEARAAILTSLGEALKRGDKQLVGNAGFRRFLATPREGHFAIDAKRVADDARLDGLHVLRTNSTLNTLSVALAYRELWKVAAIFRSAKAILETRPIYHQCDVTISGHLFCSFLAQQCLHIGGIARPDLRTDRPAFAIDHHANDDLTQIGTMVLGSSVSLPAGAPRPPATLASGALCARQVRTCN